MFSELLKELRSTKRTTQGQLAKEVGVSPGNVGDWETGKSKPGYTALAALARFFEVSADYLLELEPENASPKINSANLECDGIPLSEDEADLVAMYRILDTADKKTAFDITKLKYEQAIGEKESIYSTYQDTKKKQKSDPANGSNSVHGIA